MNYIIIGLGSFGGALAQNLTELGNEVIGIDNDMNKVELYKEKVSHVICMDTTDQFTMSGVPFKEADVVIVSIGEDRGASILTTAVLKNIGVKRLVGRAISPIHETVLKAIGVDEIVHPEEEAATKLSRKLTFKGVEESFELSKNYSIVEIRVPEKYDGKTVAQVGFRREYNLVVLTTIKQTAHESNFGFMKYKNDVQGVASYDTILYKDDLLAVYGNNADIERFLKG